MLELKALQLVVFITLVALIGSSSSLVQLLVVLAVDIVIASSISLIPTHVVELRSERVAIICSICLGGTEVASSGSLHLILDVLLVELVLVVDLTHFLLK